MAQEVGMCTSGYLRGEPAAGLRFEKFPIGEERLLKHDSEKLFFHSIFPIYIRASTAFDIKIL
jgi:hypothetical protein